MTADSTATWVLQYDAISRMQTLDPDADSDEAEEPDGGTDADPAVDANPVFDDMESLVTILTFDGAAGEMRDIEARFAGRYPDAATPSEDEVREHLIGDEAVPHEIVINGHRVHATATFEDDPTTGRSTAPDDRQVMSSTRNVSPSNLISWAVTSGTS